MSAQLGVVFDPLLERGPLRRDDAVVFAETWLLGALVADANDQCPLERVGTLVLVIDAVAVFLSGGLKLAGCLFTEVLNEPVADACHLVLRPGKRRGVE